MRGNEKAVIGALFTVILGLIAFAWSAQASDVEKTRDVAVNAQQRAAVVETKADANSQRLQRIEDKLDILIERTARAGR
jgi:hypothetical protein